MSIPKPSRPQTTHRPDGWSHWGTMLRKSAPDAHREAAESLPAVLVDELERLGPDLLDDLAHITVSVQSKDGHSFYVRLWRRKP